ncbi:MAG: tRNA (N6-isopentenyl adenosine(37)-C2)-methylthiotransferase MiaB, partial [Flavobacteriaceae bacterium]|nr:tRNA (N6-isopentenyl adenosine(37)-C2)-methylthiotransferase MiaB [Flavobacteriaceae bacterium]
MLQEENKNPNKYNGEVLELQTAQANQSSKKMFIESYGCQMNFSDSEIVASILSKEGFQTTTAIEQADLI